MLTTDDGAMTDADFAKMHTWQDAGDRKLLRGWIDGLKEHGVFFSEPLDLDLAMLAAFPKAYAATVPDGGGPRTTIANAAAAVLGTSGPGATLYTGPYESYLSLLPEYRYHFLTKSKPSTHLAALTHIRRRALKTDMPPVLAEVLQHIVNRLRRD